jgi:hypothetical protein
VTNWRLERIASIGQSRSNREGALPADHFAALLLAVASDLMAGSSLVGTHQAVAASSRATAKGEVSMKRLIILAALFFAVAGGVVAATSLIGTHQAEVCGNGDC